MFLKLSSSLFGKNQRAFTLVELLLVITLLGAFSAIVLGVVNIRNQKGRALDAVKRTDMEQVSQALESYLASENTLPGVNITTVPPSPIISGVLNNFLVKWPVGFEYVVNGSGTDFCVDTLLSNGSYFKYCSAYGEIRNCTATNITQLNYCDEI